MSITPILILLAVLFIFDLYTYRSIKIIGSDLPGAYTKRILSIVHWAIFAGVAIWYLFMYFNMPFMGSYKYYKFYYFLFGITLLFYLPKLVLSFFQIIDDGWMLSQWIAKKFASEPNQSAGGMSRARFLYHTGIVVASIPFIGAAYGMIKGRWDFRIVRKTMSFDNLPASFDGYKIVQISDAHVGSFFSNYKPVEKALELINNLNADLVLFTGDLVNNFAKEAEEWIPYFKEIKAKDGKFSILGNHDYGDYSSWPSEEAKQENFNRLTKIHGEMGFDLLRNENRTVKRNGEEIAVLGVENWGVKPFPQLGDISKAKNGVENTPFKVLMSHDPSHWGYETIKNHKDVNLTLSGHTHGAQFGVELGNIKWSPVKYKYPRWAGEYTEGKQKLYVNRGIGYIGFPGRVGMPPEITVIELKRA